MPYINLSRFPADKAHHGAVKRAVETISRSVSARDTDHPDFFEYSIDVESNLFAGTYSNIYLASNGRQLPDQPLIARVYEPAARIDARRSSYMKVLKYIGKRSAGCIATYDIFFDDAGRVVIFQELALHGNLRDFLKSNRVYVPERQMREWAGQIYSGMDFLGDSGIVHRSISPKHILLTVSPEDGEKTVAKLSSFRDSVLYYDVVTSTVRLMAVQEKERAKATSNASCYNFFAPEVFGLGGGGGGNGGVNGGIGNDLYNPIPAEVWSFGATFFFANTRAFPVKYGEVSSAVDVPLAIEGALGRARNLSPEAKGWFSGLLKAGPQERTAFEAIAADPWFRAALPMSAPAAAVEDKAPPPPSPQQQPPPPQPFQLHQQLQQQQPPPAASSTATKSTNHVHAPAH
ncbi:hypothetical protein TYRP_021080 [Tyrophagus putrescentiae]|nr:hypothetical protein TYRP_021080 [Tyrophagus putrescentiae]